MKSQEQIWGKSKMVELEIVESETNYQGKEKSNLKTAAALVGVTMIPLLAVYGNTAIRSVGEEVYRGNIGEHSVIYEEGRFSFEDGIKNRMIVQKENVTYVFEDRINQTSIDWKNPKRPDFTDDILERVTIKLEGNTREYVNPWSRMSPAGMQAQGRNAIDISTPQGQKDQEVFDKANVLYNDLRGKIRTHFEEKYQAQQRALLEQNNPYIGSLETLEKSLK